MQITAVNENVDRRQRWPAGWWGVILAAVAAATAVRLVAAVVGVDVAVGSGSSEHAIGVVDVAVGSAVPALCGAAVLHLMMRWSARGRSWWTSGAGFTLVISLVTPLQAVSLAAWIVLTLLHLTTGLVVIGGLRRVTHLEGFGVA